MQMLSRLPPSTSSGIPSTSVAKHTAALSDVSPLSVPNPTSSLPHVLSAGMGGKGLTVITQVSVSTSLKLVVSPTGLPVATDTHGKSTVISTSHFTSSGGREGRKGDDVV